MPQPTTAARYFLLDDARTCSTFSMLQQQIEFLAKSGFDTVIWHFSDDQGCRIRFDCCPEIGDYPAFTTDEVRKLVCFARNAGVTLISELASLGHSRFITRLPQYQHLNENDGPYSGMCPVHPQTREILTNLLRETIDLFDPPAVHVGMDEVEIGQHPLTHAALKTRSLPDILADHLSFLRDLIVTQAGREMWMWGDGLLANAELFAKTPKDIVVCNWQYRPTASPATTQQLLDAGFDVIVASALLSHDQTLMPSNDYALRNIQMMQQHQQQKSPHGRVRGHMVTTWIPCRTVNQSQWLGWHLAAGMLRGGVSANQSTAIADFGSAFYGFDQTDTFVSACQTILAHAPQRAEWMCVTKLTPTDDNLLAEKIAQRATLFQEAADQLRDIRPQATDHLEAYEAFQLIADLLAHAYNSAQYIHALDSGELINPEMLQALIDHRTALLADLNAAWDREHFADDPAKFTPAIHYFRDDHLLLVVRDGLEELERRLAALPAGDTIPLPTISGKAQSVA